ncbi:MAG: cytochrome c oxidase subunit 3 [Pseudomonadota bacterium]|nr:cytochrome c oxidase subunit 3 [Pseudomonadota bacterium]
MQQKLIPPSPWPILASVGVFIFALGIVNWLHHAWFAGYLLVLGLGMVLVVSGLWFYDAILDDRRATKAQYLLSDTTYRWSMFWFIFSEIWFFMAFFGVLFYARWLSVPWLSGDIEGSELTHYLLWPSFDSAWPLLVTPDPSQVLGPDQAMHAWGIPALNTGILLLSGVTITLAHWSLVQNRRSLTMIWQVATILLGLCFLYMQFYEYGEAYHAYGLRLDSGIYGNIFFMMTGFHGVHVFLGTVMLIVVAFRIYHGHFSDHDHFAFEAASWYWHFVDVVWLLLFVFVYWL